MDDHYAHLELDKAEVVHNEPRRLLGAGTFGAVFAGTLNGRAVALKHVAIDENGRRGVPLAAFWKEVDTQYKLRDPGVAIVWGACACTHPPEPASASAPEHRTPCRVVVMELANASLGALLSLEPPLVGAPAATDALSVADVVTLLRQVAGALAYVHAMHVLHLDVKPANILVVIDPVSGTKSARVADFGLTHARNAAFHIPAGVRAHMTVGPTIRGTQPYMDPGFFRGLDGTQKSDVYSLGVTLWQALTRKAPYKNFEPPSIVQAVLAGQRPSAGGLAGVDAITDGMVGDAADAAVLRALVNRCWADDADARPDMADVERALVAVERRLAARSAAAPRSRASGASAPCAHDAAPAATPGNDDALRVAATLAAANANLSAGEGRAGAHVQLETYLAQRAPATNYVHAAAIVMHLALARGGGAPLPPFDDVLRRVSAACAQNAGGSVAAALAVAASGFRLRCCAVDEAAARAAVRARRPVLVVFRLPPAAWAAIDAFFAPGAATRGCVLTRAHLAPHCGAPAYPAAHAAVLVACGAGDEGLTLLNVWGAAWGDGGVFRVRSGAVLAAREPPADPEFYDVATERETPQWLPARVLVSARYGAGNLWALVTPQARACAGSDTAITNDTMGCDPVPGVSKSLRVAWTRGGVPQPELVVPEGGLLRLRFLRVVAATYGDGTARRDVADRVRTAGFGCVRFAVTNDAMGGDPAPGIVKTLRVAYEVDGGAHSVEVREGDTAPVHVCT